MSKDGSSSATRRRPSSEEQYPSNISRTRSHSRRRSLQWGGEGTKKCYQGKKLRSDRLGGHLPGCHLQRDTKQGATRVEIEALDGSVMFLNDSVTGAQSQSGTVSQRLGCVKRIEDPRGFGDSRSVIDYF